MTWTPTSWPTRRAAAAPGSDVAAHDGGHHAGVDLLPPDEHDVRGLDHRVRGFDHADQADCFHHAEGVADLALFSLSHSIALRSTF
jgi:hypothetical protein